MELCKIMRVSILSCFYIQWATCRTTSDSESLLFFNPSVARISYKEQSLNYVGPKRPVGSLIHGNIPRFKLLTQTTPQIGFYNNKDIKNDVPIRNHSQYMMFLSPKPCESLECNGIISTSDKNDEPNGKFKTPKNNSKVGKYMGPLTKTSEPFVTNSWKESWSWRSRDRTDFNQSQRRVNFKYFKNTNEPDKLPAHRKPKYREVSKTLPTPTFAIISTIKKWSKKLPSSRREIIGFRGYKIIGAEVNIHHKSLKDRLKKIVNQQETNTPTRTPSTKSLQKDTVKSTSLHQSISCKRSTVGYHSLETGHNSTLEKPTNSEKTTTRSSSYNINKHDNMATKSITKEYNINNNIPVEEVKHFDIAYDPNHSSTEDTHPRNHTAKDGSPFEVVNDRVKFFELYDREVEYEDEYEWRNRRNILDMTSTKRGDMVRRDITTLQVTQTKSSGSQVLETSTEINHWKDYTYMALYIFEPDSVYCDAVGISAHWLLTSASCLSGQTVFSTYLIPDRIFPDDDTHSSTAYVTYCGVHWDRPERINYVSSVQVHPSYKKHSHYNLGLVKVVTAMTACSGWRAVDVWTHRVSSGTPAVALGWRLNGWQQKEFNMNGRADVPKASLRAEGVSLSDTGCHNIKLDKNETGLQRSGLEKSKVLFTSDSDVTYCVSTPCSGEWCGGLGVLMAGGRLLGLWVQERSLKPGEVIVQYSSAWRAGVDWLRSTAREVDSRKKERARADAGRLRAL